MKKYFVGKLSGMFLFIFSCTCAPEALKIFPMVSPPTKFHTRNNNNYYYYSHFDHPPQLLLYLTYYFFKIIHLWITAQILTLLYLGKINGPWY